jgi:hypothetical protein
MGMNDYSPLYNVNNILVQTGLEEAYIRFSIKLSVYLQEKYARYYISLQLYQSKTDPTVFYVFASYRDVFGIDIAITEIGNKIGEIYERVWGNRVRRIPVFRFSEYTRIIPPQKSL